MRRFGTDSPEFFLFQIGDSDEVYKIPLIASLTNRQIVALDDIKGDYKKQVDWLRDFIGDVVDDLAAVDTGAIMRAWRNASDGGDVTVGESSASSD